MIPVLEKLLDTNLDLQFYMDTTRPEEFLIGEKQDEDGRDRMYIAPVPFGSEGRPHVGYAVGNYSAKQRNPSNPVVNIEEIKPGIIWGHFRDGTRFVIDQEGVMVHRDSDGYYDQDETNGVDMRLTPVNVNEYINLLNAKAMEAE